MCAATALRPLLPDPIAVCGPTAASSAASCREVSSSKPLPRAAAKTVGAAAGLMTWTNNHTPYTDSLHPPYKHNSHMSHTDAGIAAMAVARQPGREVNCGMSWTKGGDGGMGWYLVSTTCQAVQVPLSFLSGSPHCVVSSVLPLRQLHEILCPIIKAPRGKPTHIRNRFQQQQYPHADQLPHHHPTALLR